MCDKDKKDKINQLADPDNFVLALIAIVVNAINQQKGENKVLTSGNNNTFQFGNEQGAGNNVQV